MSLKALLVHVDDSDRCALRLDAAVRLARDAKAHLIGLYLVPMPELAPPFPALLPAEVIDARRRELHEAKAAAEHAFRAAAAGARLASVGWLAPEGPPIESAVAQGRCTDLFVLGQREPEGEDASFAQELIATTLLSSGRPLMVVPYIGAAATLGRSVLIAWNGSRESSRAVADAMPILERAAVVHVAADEEGEGAMAGARLVGWLGHHGVQAKVIRLGVSGNLTGEALLSRAADLGTDLVVMGGYGHARVRELVLGGVTRTMLGAMTVPVMMSH